MNFYSNGKLLLTGEYVVLDGAKSLAVPTKFGQNLIVDKIKEPQIIWGSFTSTGECWFEAVFDLKKLRLISATFNSDSEGNADVIAETLLNILKEAKRLNPQFLGTENGFMVKTMLTFPRDWGLGSSSTLINSIASWAEVDPYDLLWNAFSGSGYDIACAHHNSPMIYQLENKQPFVERIDFRPSFAEQLFFVHLNKKQNSRDGIATYRENKNNLQKEIEAISSISYDLFNSELLTDFEKLIVEHEKIISAIIKLNPIKETTFSDYFGTVKSLGAWGGDFVLATGNETTPNYFKNKGFETVLKYSEMVL
jgi:mevalonate kinase